MGAINNAFNQAAGAAAGAALAIKHAKETEESKMYTAENAALIARNQARAADAEAKAAKLEEEPTFIAAGDAAAKEWDAEQAYSKARNRKNASYKTKMKKLTELDAAKKAYMELTNKLKGIDDMVQRAAEQRAHADKATQLAEKAQQKYQSRWGIK